MTRSLSRIAIATSVTLSLLSSISPVSAQTLSENIKTSVKQQVQSAKEEIKQVTEELTQEKLAIIDDAFTGMKEQFATATQRMRDIAAGMTTKVNELASKGVDTSAVKGLIANAQAKLQSVVTDIAKAQAQLKGFVTAIDRQAAFQAFRTTVESIQENLKSAQTALRDAALKLRTIYQTLNTAA